MLIKLLELGELLFRRIKVRNVSSMASGIGTRKVVLLFASFLSWQIDRWKS